VLVEGDVDVAAAAALIAEPARAALLLALMEEDTLSARELAAWARIAPSTASGHLARLVDGGVITGERHGRHRYFPAGRSRGRARARGALDDCTRAPGAVAARCVRR
jgi:DNA-binding transcriptional ArsR family regulator